MAKKAKSEPAAEVVEAPAVAPEPTTPEPIVEETPKLEIEVVPEKEAAAPEKEVAPEKDVADELRESDQLNELLGLPKKDAPASEAKADETPAKEAKADDEKPAVAEKKLKVKATPKAEPKVGLSAEEVAKIAAQTVAEFRKSDQPPAVEAATPELPDDLKESAADYAELERIMPKKYQPGLVQRIAGFKTLELARAEKWEKDNPGEAYNSEDKEHAEFYEKHQPVIDQSDLDRARIRREIREELQSEIRPELEEVRRTQTRIKVEPSAQAAAAAVGEKLFRTLNEAHKGEVNETVIKEWADAEPVAAAAARAAAEEFLPVVYTASLLWDGAEKFDGSNPVHTSARNLFTRMETELAAVSPGELINEAGQNWVSLNRYNALPTEQKMKFYTTTKEALVNYAGLLATDKAKQTFTETDAKARTNAEFYMKKLGYTKPVAAETAQEDNGKAALAIAPARSPSIGGGTPTAPSKGATPTGQPAPPDLIDGLLGLRQLG